MTLQELSSGRVILGTAIGDYPAEFNVMNVAYRERAMIMDEYLEVLRKILRGGSVSHDGKLLRFDDAHFYPRVNPPPILVGGGVLAVPEPNEDRLVIPVLRRSALLGDGWIPDWGKPDLIHEGAEVIKDLRRRYGREEAGFVIAFCTSLHLADSDEEAVRGTFRSLEFAEQEANIVAKYGTRTPRKYLDKSLIGTVGTVVKRIEEYSKSGVTHFKMTALTPDLGSLLEMMERFVKDVSPLSKDSNQSRLCVSPLESVGEVEF